MLQLALDLESSATLLGTDPDTFLDYVQREQLAGVIKLNGSWRVSIFTLAALLNTTPANLLELLEDYMLGQLLEAVESDEWFEDEAGQQIYQCGVTLKSAGREYFALDLKPESSRWKPGS